MNISIFGLGYVGCVGMGCLASQGHKIVGVDVSDKKVELINQGIPTIVEKGIDELILKGHILRLLTRSFAMVSSLCSPASSVHRYGMMFRRAHRSSSCVVLARGVGLAGCISCALCIVILSIFSPISMSTTTWPRVASLPTTIVSPPGAVGCASYGLTSCR